MVFGVLAEYPYPAEYRRTVAVEHTAQFRCRNAFGTMEVMPYHVPCVPQLAVVVASVYKGVVYARLLAEEIDDALGCHELDD